MTEAIDMMMLMFVLMFASVCIGLPLLFKLEDLIESFKRRR